MNPGLSYPELWQQLFDTPSPVVFVTGSASDRVGRRIADYFATAGCQTILHGNRSDSAPVVPGGGLVLKGDLRNPETITTWRTKIVEDYGRVDVVVNSAAIWDPKPLEDLTHEDWDRYWEVNARGTALVCQEFGLQMVAQPMGGCIINIGDWAVCRPYRNFSSYFPSKAAVVAITESMAVELANRNHRIRVNAILPGPVKLATSVSETHRDKIIHECLLRREGSADDVAAAAVFLASSPFITGVSLPVDGGRTIYAGPSADPVAHPDASQ